jgi:hypothetical protein
MESKRNRKVREDLSRIRDGVGGTVKTGSRSGNVFPCPRRAWRAGDTESRRVEANITYTVVSGFCCVFLSEGVRRACCAFDRTNSILVEMKFTFGAANTVLSRIPGDALAVAQIIRRLGRSLIKRADRARARAIHILVLVNGARSACLTVRARVARFTNAVENLSAAEIRHCEVWTRRAVLDRVLRVPIARIAFIRTGRTLIARPSGRAIESAWSKGFRQRCTVQISC